MELIHKNLDLTLKSADEAGHFSGLANATEIIDAYGDIIHEGAFKRTIKAHKGKIPVLKGHNSEREIGMTLSLSEDGPHGKGLNFEDAMLYVDDANPRNEVLDAREELVRMRHRNAMGRPMGISIGATIPKGKAERNEDTGGLHIYEVALWEISTTPFPANAPSAVANVKSLLDMPAMARRVADTCKGPLCAKNRAAVEATITTLQSLLHPEPEALQSDSAKGGEGLDTRFADPEVLHSAIAQLAEMRNKATNNG